MKAPEGTNLCALVKRIQNEHHGKLHRLAVSSDLKFVATQNREVYPSVFTIWDVAKSAEIRNLTLRDINVELAAVGGLSENAILVVTSNGANDLPELGFIDSKGDIVSKTTFQGAPAFDSLLHRVASVPGQYSVGMKNDSFLHVKVWSPKEQQEFVIAVPIGNFILSNTE